jgi:uncharacterized protein
VNCPRCSVQALSEIDRDGITIDRCEGCRGIWLDRGELEKLLARAKDESPNHSRLNGDRDDDDDGRDGHRRDDDDRSGGRRGKRAWWEIFD